jgi:hypothetical protein
MWGLELAMCEVRRELKATFDIVWLFLCNTATLELNRYAE